MTNNFKMRLPQAQDRNLKKNLMCTQEVATLLGLKKQTLEKWRSMGQGPKFVKLGNRAIRYRATDIEAL